MEAPQGVLRGFHFYIENNRVHYYSFWGNHKLLIICGLDLLSQGLNTRGNMKKARYDPYHQANGIWKVYVNQTGDKHE